MSNYFQHGGRHNPRGTDPSLTDAWSYVTTAATNWSSATTYAVDAIVHHDNFNYRALVSNFNKEPAVNTSWLAYWRIEAAVFLNGHNLAASSAIPNPVPLRFRLSVGPPNLMLDDGSGIDVYTQHQVEIQGDVDTASLLPGNPVFVIPPEYRHDYDVPVPTHDSSGSYVPCRLLASGTYIWGHI